MKNYLDLANGGIFYLCTTIIVLFIIFQAAVFTIMAFKRGKVIGLTREQMLKAFRTGAVSTIVPTIAVVVALIAMAPVLGIPVPWMRLSVIGSAPYELMAAGIGAKSMGLSGLGGSNYTGEAFAASVWVMCVGSFWSISIVAIFFKKLKARYSKTVDKDPKWRDVLTNAAFLGVFCLFIGEPIVEGGLALVTLISGAVIMTILAVIITKFKQKWLREFALAFSMLGAMLCSILFSNL